MILPPADANALIETGKVAMSIPDKEDIYGWVCGRLADDPRKHIYSTIHDTSNDHRVIVARNRVYKINTGYETPVLTRAHVVMIHRGDNNNWIIHLENEGQ